jgi:hypothetical protein
VQVSPGLGLFPQLIGTLEIPPVAPVPAPPAPFELVSDPPHDAATTPAAANANE